MRDTESKEKNVLVGFAVDVSGSMQKSIRNEHKKDVNRFESFKESLRKLSRQTKRAISDCRQDGYKASINVFSYVFGLRIFPNCDFISLINLRKDFANKSNQSSYGKNPYIELKNIGEQNGIQDMSGFGKWIEKILNCDEARRLVHILNKYPIIARSIAILLPRNISEVYRKEIGNWVPIYNLFTHNSYCEYKTNLKKAEMLAKELANAASDNKIIEIVIREIGEEKFGYNIKEELAKYGEVLMPLEELADLLETQEKELGNIEPFIYGNTPIKGTLELIIKRFEKELKQMPVNTIPVLFLLSDGEPTDGDPLPVAEFLKNKGVSVVSCFITDQDLIHPRCLFNEIQPNWTEEAILMYEMASYLKEDGVFAGSLKELGWTIPVKSKMFVQVNHSEILDEFIQIVLDPIRNRI